MREKLVTVFKKHRCYTAHMKTNGNDKALESYKIFPYLAWTLIIGFSYYVYVIAMNLQETAERLSAQADLLEMSVNNPTKEPVDSNRTTPNN